MGTTYYTGIDQHKRSSYLTTVGADGDIVRAEKLKNNPDAIRAYFRTLAGEHEVTVESTTGWYWMSDLLSTEGIDLSLAHATFVKAISGPGAGPVPKLKPTRSMPRRSHSFFASV